ncbi:potassium channel family protein [Halopiger aswanensis]|uniref:Ion channel n=1 Tax=Halopiger aswanensis TaxID=148449 RepID=A0A3R7D7P3_9EURY|nr:potassium channel family protein [Halopiger aswanensis]RKD89017.1 ion channel [Halopiger aswanensis]
MNAVYLALGIVLLAVAVVDLLWTTLWVEGGAGPLTSRLMARAWRALRRIGAQNSRLLSLSGPLLFVITLALWIALLWVGWTLVFAGAETVLVDTLGRGTISWSDRLYFTGYTIFTLGIGDFAPKAGRWQLVTILATGSGLLFVTLIVTYTLSVLDAVTQKRAFASSVSGFGTHGEEIVRTSWTDGEFRGLELPLHSVVTQLAVLTENHKAYPILHYFHSGQPDQAPTKSIAIFDDALTLYRFGVPQRARPSALVVTNARSSVENYLETLREGFVVPADRSPPPPALPAIREAGIPTVSDEAFESALDELETRRRLLYGLVESDAREWPSSESDDPLDADE